MKLLFIHRSVGHHLIEKGQLRPLLEQEGVELDDFDNNLGWLTKHNELTVTDALAIPGNNTNPDNLAQLFSQWNDLFNNYDAIMIKSCYPNSHIKNQQQLDQIKADYETITTTAQKHKKPLIILTTPPLRPIFTNKTEAKLADELAAWLVAQATPGLYVFNFRKLLSDSHGRLKAGYRHRLMPWDNHPNARAHRNIAPKLADFLGAIITP